MVSIVYLIINLHNLVQGKSPALYIGSKKDGSLFENYWSSSGHVAKDISSLGIVNFTKVKLWEGICTTEELLSIEASIQRTLNAKESGLFYNKCYATGPFFCEDGARSLGTVWMNNGVVNKRVKASSVDMLKSQGYTIGRLGGDYNKERIYINNGVRSKSIRPDQLSYFKTDGWIEGRLIGNQKDKRWVHRDNERKLIPSSAFQNHILDGWEGGWSTD